MVPRLANLREEILRELHCSRFVVHPGGVKMYHDLRHKYYWSGMKQQEDFSCRCLTCQQVKVEHQRPAGLLQPLEVAELKWEHVMTDFFTHLPQTLRGHEVAWVIMDQVTKFGSLFGYADDLHSGGIQQVIHTGDCPITWSASLYSIGSGSHVYSSFLGEFLASLGDTVDDEHNFSSPDG